MPFKPLPFLFDFEEHIKFMREYEKLTWETGTLYQDIRHQKFIHPNREDSDDSIINDAEFRADVMKRLNEQRHEMAIKCVKLGIYKDTYEALEGHRKVMVQRSQYKYKDLLYRNI